MSISVATYRCPWGEQLGSAQALMPPSLGPRRGTFMLKRTGQESDYNSVSVRLTCAPGLSNLDLESAPLEFGNHLKLPLKMAVFALRFLQQAF